MQQNYQGKNKQILFISVPRTRFKILKIRLHWPPFSFLSFFYLMIVSERETREFRHSILSDVHNLTSLYSTLMYISSITLHKKTFTVNGHERSPTRNCSKDHDA